MSGEVSTLRADAEEAARRAGKILADRFEGVRTIEFKGGIDLVTDADKASEAELISFLRARHPDHAVLAEESGYSPGTGGYRWVLDPLDGTTNYAHRVPHFCVSVAVEGPDGLLAGVIFDPLRDELFSAGRGQGASLNGRPISVSPTADLSRALLCTGFPYDVREKPDAPLGLFNRLMKRAQGIRRMGSAALDLAYVACGRYDGFFEFGLQAWDLAAGALLVREAGGSCDRIDGAPLDLAVGDLLAVNAGLSAPLRSETQRFLAEIRWSPVR
ncbi:MAG: inositol monophosphatase [Myxococcota bacterium]|nr:inositol monophosphatase [Myxococcota bacterium]